REIIEENGRKFGAMLTRKDYAGLASLYTEDGEVLPPDSPVVSGRKGIEEFWTSAAAALKLQSATLHTRDVQAFGDVACETGEADLELEASEVRLKYLVVWHRGGDGVWRLHRDIWNGAGS